MLDYLTPHFSRPGMSRNLVLRDDPKRRQRVRSVKEMSRLIC